MSQNLETSLLAATKRFLLQRYKAINIPLITDISEEAIEVKPIV